MLWDISINIELLFLDKKNFFGNIKCSFVTLGWLGGDVEYDICGEKLFII